MYIPLKGDEETISLREETRKCHDTRRYQTTAIESGKWKDIENSEIDREECDDREDDLPGHSYCYDLCECRAYSYGS